jgi:hypothetical protein
MRYLDNFKEKNGKYILMQSKISHLIGGLLSSGLGLALILPLFIDARFGSSISNWVLSMSFGGFLCGLGILAFGTARARIVFDPLARTITHMTSAARIKEAYSFDDFYEFHELKIPNHKAQALWMIFFVNGQKKILSLSGVSNFRDPDNLSHEIQSIMAAAPQKPKDPLSL